MIWGNTVINASILNAYFHLSQNKQSRGEIVRIINKLAFTHQDMVAFFVNITI
jgi:hypothetical protein